MTTPKRRRTGYRRAATSQPAGSYRPREHLSPMNMVDLVDRHVSRATETNEALGRYLKLLRFARATALEVGILLIISCILLIAAIVAAVVLAGLPPWAAIGIGAGGTLTAIITAIFKARRYLKARSAAATDLLTRQAPSAVGVAQVALPVDAAGNADPKPTG